MDSSTTARPDHPVRLRELTYLAEGDEVTVGCRETDSYCVLPPDGAALLRRLGDGEPPEAAAHWYAETYGEPVDLADFLDTMAELGFLRTETAEPAAAGAPVRWQRLGRAVFSPAGAVLFLVVLAAAVVLVVRRPDLAPSYRGLFFSRYLTVIALTAYLGQFPLLLLHEAAHALAGRRLGLPSRLRVSHRLYFLVFETALDGLVTVPRKRRLLPILAGVLCDVLVMAVLTLLAGLLRGPVPVAAGVALALAFTTLLRLAWQLYFYLRTDLYYLVITAFGCHDLHGAARALLADDRDRLLRRPRTLDRTAWTPADLAVGRWYRWLVVAGYAFSLGTLAFAGIPAMIQVVVSVVTRLAGGARPADVADVVTVLVLTLAQFAVVGVIALRNRRAAAPAPA